MSSKKSKHKKNDFAPIDQEQLKKLEEKIKATAIEFVPIDTVFQNPKNAKQHPDHQVSLLAESIRKFGFTSPLIIDEAGNILAGHGRFLAARRIGMTGVPAVRMKGLSPEEKIALALSDNKISELGELDADLLADNLKILIDAPELNFDIALTGFDTVEIDNILYGEKPKKKAEDAADKIPALHEDQPPVSTFGDLWRCGVHTLLCGDAQSAESYRTLLGEERADMLFSDPPYNVPIRGHVSKRRNAREFMMASGELTSDEFIAFLRNIAALMADNVRPGGVMYVCIDWGHYGELLQATHRILGQPKNLIVWAKDNAGMGSFYRSQHELIPVFVAPGASPTNNFKLGTHRYRTNVWQYPGVNTLGADRDATLAMHPTVKPVALVSDAIRDCSHRGEIILDPFGGSGTTMIAAQKTGRRARLMEIDPRYCDVIVRRFEAFTGEQAVLADTGDTFSQVMEKRGSIEVSK